MSETAINCKSLSKSYRIGRRERYASLREVLSNTLAAPLRRVRRGSRTEQGADGGDGLFWALRDVSFEVRRGEAVGIIGRNGAGKSTLLKILSRITGPTRGLAEIHGRVGSLLEVGTGFHPELTGRENIYLNGAILGMHKAEIDRKFDEIVAFAEVERFLDTPVKRYSSGMYVRLAFGVAAHMETEILLVDEVLAVGDASFQKKCMTKMGSVAQEGRTILFVSHTMAAIQSLCTRAILLDGGKVLKDGDTTEVIEHYISYVGTRSQNARTDLSGHPNRRPKCARIFSSVTTKNAEGVATSVFAAGDDLVLEFELEPPFPIREPTLGIGIDNSMGLRIFSVTTYFSKCDWGSLDGPTRVRCTVPHIQLTPGQYSMNLSVGTLSDTLMDAIDLAASFTVEAHDYFGTGRLPHSSLGVVLSRSRWEFQSS